MFRVGLLIAGAPCAEFALHSSELMPGGSPTFGTEQSIERLYRDLERLFAAAAEYGFRGATLAEFRADFHLKTSHLKAGVSTPPVP